MCVGCCCGEKIHSVGEYRIPSWPAAAVPMMQNRRYILCWMRAPAVDRYTRDTKPFMAPDFSPTRLLVCSAGRHFFLSFVRTPFCSGSFWIKKIWMLKKKKWKTIHFTACPGRYIHARTHGCPSTTFYSLFTRPALWRRRRREICICIYRDIYARVQRGPEQLLWVDLFCWAYTFCLILFYTMWRRSGHISLVCNIAADLFMRFSFRIYRYIGRFIHDI